MMRSQRIRFRWPKWLDEYASWHPLHSTGYDLYKNEAFARHAKTFSFCRRLLANAYADLARFEDPSVPTRIRVAAGERAADRFLEASLLAAARRAERNGTRFGATAVTGVTVNGHPSCALVATEFPRTILDRHVARSYSACLWARRGTIMYRGRRLQGNHARVTVEVEKRVAEVIAFVPRRRFPKGIMLGRDWLAQTGATVDLDGDIAFARVNARAGKAT